MHTYFTYYRVPIVHRSTYGNTKYSILLYTVVMAGRNDLESNHVAFMVGHDDDVVLDPQTALKRPGRHRRSSKYAGLQSDRAIVQCIRQRFPQLKSSTVCSVEELILTKAKVQLGNSLGILTSSIKSAHGMTCMCTRLWWFSPTAPNHHTAGIAPSSPRCGPLKIGASSYTHKLISRHSYPLKRATCTLCIRYVCPSAQQVCSTTPIV